ncbi:MAG TPA: hypothetical protein VGM39_03630 [Kofleriaceae bacterium]
MQKFAVVLTLCAVASATTGCAKAMVATGGVMTIGGTIGALSASDDPDEPDNYAICCSQHDGRVLGLGIAGVGLALIVGGLLLDGGHSDDAKETLKLTMDRSNPFATQSGLSMRGGL